MYTTFESKNKNYSIVTLKKIFKLNLLPVAFWEKLILRTNFAKVGPINYMDSLKMLQTKSSTGGFLRKIDSYNKFDVKIKLL